MPRLLTLISLAVTSLTVSAAPVPKPLKDKATPSVEGTIWIGEHIGSDLGQLDYIFEEGGKLITRKQGRTHVAGTWRQDGGKLEFDLNNKYVECSVNFQDGQFEGPARNVKGKTWTVKLTRPENK